MDTDGYSKFNQQCIDNLNQLLSYSDFEIWLSSTRRTVKTLDEFNKIFKHRNSKQKITGFLPDYPNCINRKEEITQFIKEMKLSNFLILDDDKSLNDLEEEYKVKLVLTKLYEGLNKDQLELAKNIGCY